MMARVTAPETFCHVAQWQNASEAAGHATTLRSAGTWEVPAGGGGGESIEKRSLRNVFGSRIRFATRTPTERRSIHDDVGQPKWTCTSRPASSSSSSARTAQMLR